MKTKMPKPDMERNIVKDGDTIKITATEKAEYTQEQLDEVFMSLKRTKFNIENQKKGYEVQIDQLMNHVVPDMVEKLLRLDADLNELESHVGASAKAFDPVKEAMAQQPK